MFYRDPQMASVESRISFRLVFFRRADVGSLGFRLVDILAEPRLELTRLDTHSGFMRMANCWQGSGLSERGSRSC